MKQKIRQERRNVYRKTRTKHGKRTGKKEIVKQEASSTGMILRMLGEIPLIKSQKLLQMLSNRLLKK